MVNQGDLNPGNEDFAYRNFKFVIDSVRGKQAISSFKEMRLTADKKASMIRKWHTLIEAHQDVTTADGYILRVFVNGVTRRRQGSKKKTAYATTGQAKIIRKIMIDVISEEFTGCEISKIMRKVMYEKIGKEVMKKASKIYPLQTCLTTKIKVLKRPMIEEEAQ
ncbi:40S ribosomal protein S1 [Astathelohania contejeani]|uniref:40S ribosomal protein S1 n=1 Tax=Astathelohania contejeani TaxID=164912 RepID=A0ABQ7I2K6_9MICR|nr:40S ribosomal protein S1 [Thelohania contejeani]